MRTLLSALVIGITLFSAMPARAETPIRFRDLSQESERLNLPAYRPKSDAGSCRSIDLRSQIPGPPRDQERLPWCPQFAAGDVISEWIGRPVSRLDMGLSYFKHLKNPAVTRKVSQDRDGAFLAESIQVMLDREKGFCAESALPSSAGENVPETEILSRIAQIERMKEEMDRENAPITRPCPNCIRNVQRMFPGLDGPTILRVLKESSKGNELFALQEQACAKNRISARIDGIDSAVVPPGSAQGGLLISGIDERLESGSSMLVGMEDFVSPEEARLRRAESSGGLHASTVVGRRFNPSKGQCEYLVRGTWGADCRSYNSEFECEGGHLWVGEETLADNLVQTVSVSGTKRGRNFGNRDRVQGLSSRHNSGREYGQAGPPDDFAAWTPADSEPKLVRSEVRNEVPAARVDGAERVITGRSHLKESCLQVFSNQGFDPRDRIITEACARVETRDSLAALGAIAASRRSVHQDGLNAVAVLEGNLALRCIELFARHERGVTDPREPIVPFCRKIRNECQLNEARAALGAGERVDFAGIPRRNLSCGNPQR